VAVKGHKGQVARDASGDKGVSCFAAAITATTAIQGNNRQPGKAYDVGLYAPLCVCMCVKCVYVCVCSCVYVNCIDVCMY